MATKTVRRASLSVVLCLLGVPLAIGAEAAKPATAQTGQEQAADASVKLFDTGHASSAALSGEAVAKAAGWTTLPEDKTEHKFAGDAVLVNDRLAIVFRRGGPGAEVYGKGPQGYTMRAVLAPAGESSDAKLASLAIIDNSAAEVVLNATFNSPDGKSQAVRYALSAGQVYVKTEAGAGTKALTVNAPSHFVVLPDFFADDMVVNATQIPVATAELPSENFLVHLPPDRNAIVITVADSREKDAMVTLSGKDSSRLIDRSEVFYGDGKVCVAVLEAPGIWHHRDIRREETDKILPLEWKAPFPAQWRVDWQGVEQSHQQLGDDRQAHRRAIQQVCHVGQRRRGDFQRPPLLGHRVRQLRLSLLVGQR